MSLTNIKWTIQSWLRKNWPLLVSRKKFEEQKSKASFLQYRLDQQLSYNKTLGEDVQRIMDRLMRTHISLDYHAEYRTARLVVEVSQSLMETVLMHGNDQRILDSVADQMAHRVRIELSRLNVWRSPVRERL